MGRRAKRAQKEVYLRQRIESIPAPGGMKAPTQERGKIRMRKTNAVVEWAEKVFKPKHNRYPTTVEACAAVDSGEVGRWIASHYEAKVIKREIVVGDKVIPYEQWTKKPEKVKDMRYADEQAAKRKERREKHWRKESEREVIAAAVAGTLKATPEILEAEAQKRYAYKVSAWEIEQLFSKNK